jgi:hypothetical protein
MRVLNGETIKKFTKEINQLIELLISKNGGDENLSDRTSEIVS